jgi:hypothetical protein
MNHQSTNDAARDWAHVAARIPAHICEFHGALALLAESLAVLLHVNVETARTTCNAVLADLLGKLRPMGEATSNRPWSATQGLASLKTPWSC